MTKYFDYLNLALLTALGGLCVVQWSHEKDYSRQLGDLRQTSSQQADKLVAQEESLQHAREDIEGFKHEIEAFKTQADENNAQIRQQKAQVRSTEPFDVRLPRAFPLYEGQHGLARLPARGNRNYRQVVVVRS